MYNCYILRSLNPLYLNKTYIGSTNNLQRRIRQHNGELVGGAKATYSARPHEHYCIISGFPNHVSALRCEWLLKHPDNKRKRSAKYNGINGRIIGLNHLLIHSEKWNLCKENVQLTIKIKEKFVGLLELDKITDIISYF